VAKRPKRPSGLEAAGLVVRRVFLGLDVAVGDEDAYQDRLERLAEDWPELYSRLNLLNLVGTDYENEKIDIIATDGVGFQKPGSGDASS
jgi:hypothetical protein